MLWHHEKKVGFYSSGSGCGSMEEELKGVGAAVFPGLEARTMSICHGSAAW